MAAALSSPFLAAACALPPAVTVAGLAADGVSYAVSGRAVTDHAISLAAQEDCALYRAVQGESICRDEAAAEGTMALNGAGEPIQLAAAPAEAPMPEEAETPVTPAEVASTEEASDEAAIDKPAPSVPAEKRWVYPGRPGITATFLALGSYRFRTNAVSVAEQYAELSPYVVTVFLEEERYYRVVVGPYKEDELAAARKKLLEAGVSSPWRVKVCGAEGVGMNCGKAG